MLINVDMINGFIRVGNLKSQRIEGIVDKVMTINKSLALAEKVFFIDKHNKNSAEFSSFAEHCIDEEECKVIKELEPFLEDSKIFYKNSINGVFAKGFLDFLNEKIDKIDSIVIVGCCSDLCVSTLAISIRTYLNEFDKNINIYVPVNAIETYSHAEHDGDLLNTMALYMMYMQGIKLIKV